MSALSFVFSQKAEAFGVSKDSQVLELSPRPILKSNLSQALTSYTIKSVIMGQILFSVTLLKPTEINVRLDFCNREEFGLLS